MNLNNKGNENVNVGPACHLDAALARSLYPVVVVPGAARTAGGALPQEVKRASVACSRRTGAAPTDAFKSFNFLCDLVISQSCSATCWLHLGHAHIPSYTPSHP